MTATVRHLNIEVTRRCDQRCTYCFNDSGPDAQYAEMTLNQWLAFVGHLSLLGLESVHITGGEPFVSPITIPLLREAQALDLSTSILSNGLRIPKVIQENPDLLRRLGVAQISLDGMDPALHDKRRGRQGAWHQAMLAIAAMRQLGVPLEISCTVDCYNVLHVDDLAAYCRSIGALLILRPVVPLGRASLHSHGPLRRSLTHAFRAHADVLTLDRFRYVPVEPKSDQDALDVGILTVLPNGCFRAGSISIASHRASCATELLEAA